MNLCLGRFSELASDDLDEEVPAVNLVNCVQILER